MPQHSPAFSAQLKDGRWHPTPLQPTTPAPGHVPIGQETSTSAPQLHHTLHSPNQRPLLRPPHLKRTKALAWCGTICCAILSTAIIVGGIAVLVIYLFFRPHNPHLNIAHATLNAAYLDVGVDSNTTLLNADITLLANFSNPNSKVDVVFTRLDLNLYFGATLIAVAGVDPFAERHGESQLRSLHMIASEVALPQKEVETWRLQTAGSSAADGGLMMELNGRMRTRLEFGSILRFNFWLYSRCSLVMGVPPGGTLRSVLCRSKR
ncbi:hypothetical protein HPP92_025848 [Vanilla planifolia]|uniref:Late embryogenesis abundant protein LEA-2 subgroup domain-containing protein n=1 Tax=Vanilla planifolia TaxID=51239 RepID=A0A835PE63_VANPL|nr:hypothetical protein HPP92_025848 [Vanilla planifolia]